jgi:hypothetical protein
VLSTTGQITDMKLHLLLACAAFTSLQCSEALRLDLPDAGTPEAKRSENSSDQDMRPATSGVVQAPARPDPKQKTCKSGFQLKADACVDIDECAKDNGGCDDTVICHNRDGSHSCGDCAEGYIGGAGDVCIPILTGLELSPGTLNEPVSASIQQYQIALPIWAGVLSLTPAAPDAAQIEIDGTAVKPGEAWQSQPLPLGETRLQLVLTQTGHPQREYEIVVQRGRGKNERIHGTEGVEQAFGDSVAISGDTLVVGAPGDFSGASGIDGVESNPSSNGDFGGGRGAAYVYVREGERWSRQAYLKASNPDTRDEFGVSVAVSGDTIVVGADYEDGGVGGPNANPYDNSTQDSGAAYVFIRSVDAWSQQAYLKASDPSAGERVGTGVGISGETIVVGSTGKTRVFVREGDDWSLQAELEGGYYIALDGDTLATGQHIYGRVDGVWSMQGEIPTGPKAIHGDTVAAASFGGDEGSAKVFVRSGTSWSQQALLQSPDTGNDQFGCAVALWGDALVVGAWGDDSSASGLHPERGNGDANQAGAIHVYQRTGATWSQRLYAKASDPHRWDYFGKSVAIANDTIAVGAMGWGNSTIDSTRGAVSEGTVVFGYGAGYLLR